MNGPGLPSAAPPGVLLGVMPFHQGSIPAIGVSLLKGALVKAGVGCDIHYANLRYADFAGEQMYADFGEMDPNFMSLAGEWIFSEALFGTEAADPRAYLEEIVLGRFGWIYDRAFAERILAARSQAGTFLDGLIGEIDWRRYAIVGATSTFQQNTASLAFLKRVKAIAPRIVTVIGGANCEGEMGWALRDQFPFLDYVCTGKSDWSFPALVEQILAGNPRPRIAGVVSRRDRSLTGVAPIGPAAGVLDELPYPDYDDFFVQFEASSVARHHQPYLPIETSRGCWWGAKHHCTFCGLNGDDMQYRSKSPARVIDEIDYLESRHGPHEFQVVDNILDMKHIDSVLGRFAERARPPKLFYETKANLSKSQLRTLRRAGVYMIQPGVESLSTPILQLMKKGVTGLQNVRLLKWCEEVGINPAWNFLYGFPDEDPREYERIAGFIPSLVHLPPAWGIWIVDIHRFSPFHSEPQRHGFTKLRAGLAYRYVYPFPDTVLDRLAYFFDYERIDGRDADDYSAVAQAALVDWRSRYREASLRLSVDGQRVAIRDGRGPGVTEVVLEGPAARAYLALDAGATAAAVQQRLGREAPDRRHLARLFDEWECAGYVLREDDLYLGLAVNLDERICMPGETAASLRPAGGPFGHWQGVAS